MGIATRGRISRLILLVVLSATLFTLAAGSASAIGVGCGACEDTPSDTTTSGVGP